MRWNSQSISAPYVDTFSGSHQSSMLASLLALLLHLEPDLHHLARLDVDLLRLLAERLVPDLDGLLARRHVLDLGRAAGVRDREERGRQDRHPAEHPAVHVAGELDDLGLLELLHHHLLELRLRLVDGRVCRRVRMDVVQDVVGVLELEVARRHRGHVRHELAAMLVDRRLRHLRRALGGRDGDDRVGQALVAADHDLLDHGLGPALLGVLVDLELLDDGRAVIRDRDLDGAPSLGVHRVRALDEQRDARDARSRQDDSNCSAHFSHRSRYTASASPPMRKYGRSAPSATFWGNWSETTSGEAFFAASAPDCVGSSQVTWKATSLSFHAARSATMSMEGLKFRGSMVTCPTRGMFWGAIRFQNSATGSAGMSPFTASAVRSVA